MMDFEKSPAISCAVGTRSRVPTGLVYRQPLYPPEKNILFLMIGPVAVAPNWFWRKGKGPLRLASAKVSRALKKSLRTNSKADPCNFVRAGLGDHIDDAPR